MDCATGRSAGHDVAPWSDDRKASGILCLNYSTKSNHDNFYACANGINDGKYAYNNLQDFDGTWYHRFNARWHTATEAWYMYEREVPNIAGNVANPVTPELGANGAFCRAGVLRCTAPEYAIVNYINREIDSKTRSASAPTCSMTRKASARASRPSTRRTRCMRHGTWGRRCCFARRSGSTTRGTRRAITTERRGTSSLWAGM